MITIEETVYNEEEIKFIFEMMLDEEVIITVGDRRFFKKPQDIFAYVKKNDSGFVFETKYGTTWNFREFTSLSFTNVEKIKKVHKLVAIKRTFKK
jgi:hypothetical protein